MIQSSVPPNSAPEAVLHALDRARTDPANDELWDELDEVAREFDRPEEVSLAYREILNQKLDPAVRARLGRRAVAFHEEWYEEPTLAIGILEKLVDSEDREWAFERLTLILTMAQRWDELLAQYDRALGRVVDVEARLKLLDEAARVAKDFAGQAQRANSYLKELLFSTPENDQLAEMLERRLEQHERHNDLVDIWNARLAVLQGDRAREVRVQIASRQLEQLSDARAALQVTEEILEEPEGQEPGLDLLERIGHRADADVHARRQALEMLRDRYVEADRAEDVIRIAELWLTVAEDDSRRQLLHEECADWLQKLGRDTQALEHCAHWFGLKPGSETVRERLRALAEATQRWGAYVDALQRGSQAASAERRVQLQVEAGQVSEEHVQDTERALSFYLGVLADEAAEASAQLLVARRARPLLSAASENERLLHVLEQLATLEPEREGQRAVLGDAAELADSIGDVDRALGLWQRCLELSPEDVGALDARIALLERAERWESLIVDLRQRSEVIKQAPHQRADLVRIARIYETRLFRLEEAIKVWREVESEFGSNAETVDALVDLCSAAQRFDDVIDLLTSAIQSEGNLERRTQQLSRLGDVYREHEAKPLDAVDCYRRALDYDPLHEPARSGLRALLDTAGCARLAVETLASALLRADEWPGVLELLELRVRASEDSELTYAILLEAASLVEQRAQDPASALGYVCRAFELDPNHELEADLQRLAQTSGQWADAAAGYRSAIEQCRDEERIRELHYVLGQLLEQQLADREGALASYWQIVSSEPGHTAAAQAIARVATELSRPEDVARVLLLHSNALGELLPELADTVASASAQHDSWQELTEHMRTAVEGSPDLSPRVSHDLRRQLGLWYRDERSDSVQAEQLLAKAVASHRDASTLTLLADLRRAEPGRPLVETLLQLADVQDDNLEVLHEAASVSLEQVEDVGLAQPILERTLSAASDLLRSLEEDPEESSAGSTADHVAWWAIEQLVGLEQARGGHDRALRLLVNGAQLPFDLDRQIALSFRAAQVALNELSDTELAVEVARGILTKRPDHAPTIELLGEIFENGRRYEELLELRKNELELTPPLSRRLELRLDQARILAALGEARRLRVEVLLENVEESAGHPASIDGLVELLADAGEHAQLFGILSEQAQRVAERGDASHAASLWARAAALSESALGDDAQALEAYERSVASEATVEVLDALSRLCIQKDAHESAIGWLQQRLSLTPEDDAEARETTRVSLANSLRTVGREEEARQCLVEGLEENPDGYRMRDLLAELYIAGEDFDLLAPLLTVGVDHTDDDQRKVRYLRDAASVYRHQLSELDTAIPLLEEAVSLEPKERSLRLSLADGLRQASRFEEAHDLLSTLLTEFGRRRTPERALVHYQLAQVARATGDLDKALEELDQASKVDRNNMQMLRLLGQVAREKGKLEDAERAYRTLLLLLGRSRPEPAKDTADIGESSILFELHRIAHEMGQEDRAKDLLDSALEAASSDPAEGQRLEQALRDAGQHDLLLRALDQRLSRTAAGKDRARIFVGKAEALAGLDRTSEAVDAYLSALQDNPLVKGALPAAFALAMEAGDTERVLGPVERLAEQAADAQPSTACELWLQLGRLAQQHEDDGRALKLFQQAQHTGCKPTECLLALESAGIADQPQALSEALSSFLQFADPKANPDHYRQTLLRAGQLDLQSGNLERAAQHLSEALERGESPASLLPLVRDAVSQQPPNGELTQLLERVARTEGDKPALLLAWTHAARLGVAEVAVLREAAELARELSAGAELRVILECAVEMGRDRGDMSEVVWAITGLTELLQAQGEAQRAVDLLQESIPQAGVQDSFDLRLRLAALAANPLGDTELAQRVYERLLEEAPTAIQVWRPLFQIYRERGLQSELSSCIEKLETQLQDEDLLRSLRIERVHILISSGQGEEAEQALRELLESDPSNEDASELLENLLEGQGRLSELQSLVEERLEAAIGRGDVASVTRRTLRLGKILVESDREAALEVYRRSLAAHDDNRPVLEAFLGLLGEAESDEREQTLERLISVLPGVEAEQRALELLDLRNAREDGPGVERALHLGLERMPSSSALHTARIQWFRETDDLPQLADALCDYAQHVEVEEARKLLLEAAHMQADQLGDPRNAAAALRKLLALQPEHPDPELLSQLCTHLTNAGEPEQAVQCVTESLQSVAEGSEQRAELLRLRSKLRLMEAPDSLEAISAAVEDLEVSAEVLGEEVRGDLVELLEAQLRLLGVEHDARDSVQRVLGRLSGLLQKMGNVERAIDLLTEQVARDPDDLGSRKELGRLCADVERWSDAAAAYQALVDRCEGDELLEVTLSLATVSEQAGDPGAARAALEKVHREQPGHAQVRSRLLRMYEASGEYRGSAQMLLAEAETTIDEGERCRLLCDAGDLFMKVGDEALPEALKAYETALSIEPSSEILIRAVGVQVRLDQIEEAAGRLNDAIQSHGKRRSPELSTLQHAMARVADAAGDEEAVFAWLEAALYSDRQNGVVAAELASLAMTRGDFDVAIKALQLVTLLKTPGPMSRAEAYLRQAAIARHRGDEKKSALLAKRAITTDPEYEDAKRFLEEISN